MSSNGLFLMRFGRFFGSRFNFQSSLDVLEMAFESLSDEIGGLSYILHGALGASDAVDEVVASARNVFFAEVCSFVGEAGDGARMI
jgi:hypothetical protein